MMITQDHAKNYEYFATQQNIYYNWLNSAAALDISAERVEADQEVDQIKQDPTFFASPAYMPHPASYAVLADQLAANQRFATWYEHNTSAHKVTGYRVVFVSLRRYGMALSDLTIRQRAGLAKLADRYSFGEIQVADNQKLILADVAQQDLYPVWRVLTKLGLANTNPATLS